MLPGRVDSLQEGSNCLPSLLISSARPLCTVDGPGGRLTSLVGQHRAACRGRPARVANAGDEVGQQLLRVSQLQRSACIPCNEQWHQSC